MKRPSQQRRVNCQVIMRIPWRSLRLPLVGAFVGGVGGVVAGVTNNTGILSSWGSAGRVIATGLGSCILVAMVVLVVSNVIQDWAVLVGTESGLQLIYPLGLHRFMSRSHLTGDLVDAELFVSEIEARSRFQPAQLAFQVRAAEGTLKFRVSPNGLNADYESRFTDWVAGRRKLPTES